MELVSVHIRKGGKESIFFANPNLHKLKVKFQGFLIIVPILENCWLLFPWNGMEIFFYSCILRMILWIIQSCGPA